MTLGKEGEESKSYIGGSGRLTVEAGNDVTVHGTVMTNQRPITAMRLVFPLQPAAM